MKTLTFIICTLTLLFASLNATAEESAANQLEAYIRNGDSQNVEALDKILDKDFNSVFVFKGKKKIYQMNKKKLLKNYKSGKFGGNNRSFEVKSIMESDNLSFIKAETTGPKFKFLGVYIMQKTRGVWRLKDEYLILEPSSTS